VNVHSSITIIPAGNGLLDKYVPDVNLILEGQLKKSGRLGSNHSERAYRDDVRRFNQWRASRPITKSLVEEYLRTLSDEKKSPAYLGRCLASIRWYIRAIKDLLYDNTDIVRSLTDKRRTEILERADRALQAQKPRGERAAGIDKGRYIPRTEFASLMKACIKDDSLAGVRDRAMFALAYSIGPRVHEVAGLKLKDVKVLAGPALMYHVRIIGKGNKERQVTPLLTGGAAHYLKDWLDVRGNEPGALFCYITRAGKRSGSKGMLQRMDVQLTTDALVKILKKRRIQAGLEPMTWHDFRRTYISDLINRYDLVTAQKIIGHSSTTITAKYDRTWQDKVKEAARRRSIRYALPNQKTPSIKDMTSFYIYETLWTQGQEIYSI
jgi:site-specific recombinase XerD